METIVRIPIKMPYELTIENTAFASRCVIASAVKEALGVEHVATILIPKRNNEGYIIEPFWGYDVDSRNGDVILTLNGSHFISYRMIDYDKINGSWIDIEEGSQNRFIPDEKLPQVLDFISKYC